MSLSSIKASGLPLLATPGQRRVISRAAMIFNTTDAITSSGRLSSKAAIAPGVRCLRSASSSSLPGPPQLTRHRNVKVEARSNYPSWNGRGFNDVPTLDRVIAALPYLLPLV
eukprot:scaffold124673_cov41-Prasinocladus_malaysianus.AAC.1